VLTNRILLSVAALILLTSFSPRNCKVQENKHPHYIWATEWSKDGRYIAVAGDDSTVWIYDGTHHHLHKSFYLNAMIKHVSWHPFENLLAIATTKGVELLDMKTEKLSVAPGVKVGGRALGWNYTGELLALADGAGVVQIMDKKGNHIRSIKKHNRHSYVTIDWHPSKNIVVTGSDEIILFDTSGKQLAFIPHRKENTLLLTARWHPSGEFFATGDYGHEKEGMPTLLQFWKPDGTLIKQMMGHHEEMRNLKWSSDGNLLATGADGLRIWSKEGKLLHEAVSPEVIWGLAWSKDDKQIATGSYSDGKVKLWTKDAKLVKEIK
jgi:WD40 repeat protein